MRVLRGRGRGGGGQGDIGGGILGAVVPMRSHARSNARFHARSPARSHARFHACRQHWRSSSPVPVRFRVGELVEHKHHAYKGVVVGWEVGCVLLSSEQEAFREFGWGEAVCGKGGRLLALACGNWRFVRRTARARLIDSRGRVRLQLPCDAQHARLTCAHACLKPCRTPAVPLNSVS
jgi:hypothetical protein